MSVEHVEEAFDSIRRAGESELGQSCGRLDGIADDRSGNWLPSRRRPLPPAAPPRASHTHRSTQIPRGREVVSGRARHARSSGSARGRTLSCPAEFTAETCAVKSGELLRAPRHHAFAGSTGCRADASERQSGSRRGPAASGLPTTPTTRPCRSALIPRPGAAGLTFSVCFGSPADLGSRPA